MSSLVIGPTVGEGKGPVLGSGQGNEVGVAVPKPAPFSIVPGEEVAELAALDSEFYNRTFFPAAFRQPSAPFHQEIFNRLENRTFRYVAEEVFRGGAKTTILRSYTSKRIAYGISRTVLFVSASAGHSEKSLAWLRKAVEYNTKWAGFYGLRAGKKWNQEGIEILNDKFEHTVTVLPLGITGQTRGVNVDDYRPDLIIVDDPCDEENTASPEQRKKTADLFFGALQHSLAPFSENPDAKMVLLQTSLHQEDLINTCHRDRTWATGKYSCFDGNGHSSWPARWTTEELVGEKQAHADRGQLPLWMREMECTVIGEETADFKAGWLKYWDVLPDRLVTFLAIDPVPPPSEAALLKGLARKDYEALVVVGYGGGHYFLVDYAVNRGHTPEWTVSEFFRLLDKWRPLSVEVEGVGYQRTLKWMLEKEMRERRRFVAVNVHDDKRKKRHVITQAFSGLASQGQFYVHRTHLEFIAQFTGYPNVAHDDILDASARALKRAQEYGAVLLEVTGTEERDEEYRPIGKWRQAP